MPRKKKTDNPNRLIPWDSRDFCRRCEGLTDDNMNCARGHWYGKNARKAHVVFIGEAPAPDDVEEGEFFTGRFGRVIEGWLEDSGLDRHNIYLDNAVRCGLERHIGTINGNERKKLIENCRPYLFKELERLKPHVIVPLGNWALTALTGLTGVANWRGRVLRHPHVNAYVVPTFNPGSITRGRPQWASLVMEDLDVVRGLLKKPMFKPEEPQSIFVNNEALFKKCMAEMRKSSYFSFDVETNSLHPLTDPKANLIGVVLAANTKRGYFIPFMDSESGEWDQETQVVPKHWHKQIGQLLKEKKRVKIMHNASFDLLWAWREGWEVNNLFDTQIVNAILDNMDNDLKSLAWLHTAAGSYEDVIEDHFLGVAKKNRNFATIPPDTLSHYGALDGCFTVAVYEHHQRLLKGAHKDKAKLINEQNELRMNLSLMEYHGTKTNKPHIRKLIPQYESRIAELEKVMNRRFKPFGPFLTKKEPGPFNPGSSTHVAAVLWGSDHHEGVANPRDYGLRPGKSGQYSTDKDVIKDVAADLLRSRSKRDQAYGEALAHLQEHRLLSKRISTYLLPFSQSERANPSFTQDVTRTARLSCREPNLQNIPREPLMRDILTTDPGRRLVELDYKQLELFIAAEESGDETMCRLLNTGEDIHSFVGMNTIMDAKGNPYKREVFRKVKEMRARAKIVSFSVLYGKTARSLARDLRCSEEQAQRVINLLLQETFPGLQEWIHEQWAFMHKHGYIRTLFDRELLVPNHDSVFKKEISESRRRSVNYPIQSAASDCVVVGINRVARMLKKKRIPADLRITVHDSLIAEVDDAAVDDYIGYAVEAMEAPLPQLRNINKLFVDVSVSRTSWGKVKEVNHHKIMKRLGLVA